MWHFPNRSFYDANPFAWILYETNFQQHPIISSDSHCDSNECFEAITLPSHLDFQVKVLEMVYTRGITNFLNATSTTEEVVKATAALKSFNWFCDKWIKVDDIAAIICECALSSDYCHRSYWSSEHSSSAWSFIETNGTAKGSLWPTTCEWFLLRCNGASDATIEENLKGWQ